MVTSPKAPLRSRTVGFPESGSDLGFPLEVFPIPLRLKRWLAYTPPVSVYLQARPGFEDAALPGSVPGCRPRPGPPSAQSPFAPSRRYLGGDGIECHLEGHYPLFVAHTGSCARPKPSRRLPALTTVGGSLQVAASPCWVMVLPDVISASLSQDAWARIPAGRRVHLPVSSPTSSAFPKSCRWVGFPHSSAERLHKRAGLSRSSPFFTFRPPGLFATQVSPTAATQKPQGSRDFYARAEHAPSPLRASGMLAVRTRQLTAEDFHLLDLQPCRPLPGLSPAGTMSLCTAHLVHYTYRVRQHSPIL
jgi:hypothetical protein